MINFYNEDVVFKLTQKLLLREWIQSVIKHYKFNTGEINYIFCSDKFLVTINKKYLNHDTLTDIITFDNSIDAKEKTISADIYISIDRVKENAVDFSTSLENELQRVIIHGILHLFGYSDKSAEQKKQMRELENNCLKKLEQLKKKK